MSNEKVIDDLVSKFSRLPSIGKKSATKIVYKLLQGEKEKALALMGSLQDACAKVRNCPVCNNLTEFEICAICDNTARMASGKVIVVADPLDVTSIEALGVYDGIYFVLNGLVNPLEGVNMEDSGIPQLLAFLSDNPIREVLLALSNSNEGEHTSLIINDLCVELGIPVLRFATGIPAGASFSNADSNTLLQSYLNRSSYD